MPATPPRLQVMLGHLGTDWGKHQMLEMVAIWLAGWLATVAQP